MFRYLILGFLRNGCSLHGYALMKEYEVRSGLRIGTGNFYRELSHLLARGLVRPTANPLGADARRTPYVITDAGIAVFDRWLTGRPGDRSDSDEELAARSMFFPEADPAGARQMLSHWSETLWLRSKVLERERQATLADAAAGSPDGFSTRALLISRRLAHVAADIEFLDKLTESYESWLASSSRPAAQAAPERKQRASRR